MSTVSLSLRGTSAAFAPVPPRLRLTQRGRKVLTALVATPLVIAALVFALNGGGATATLDSGATFEYVTVDGGQSLWQLAEQLAPDADPRDVIVDIMKLNQLESAEVYAGQQLAIPAQYAD
jgi:hypothetical protein